uniref:Signal recognition particle subunit SRP68 n=1 Tax=Dunaliella tertiolecta TaxID=3047 RepID=A0A7S3VUP0_DUNTE
MASSNMDIDGGVEAKAEDDLQTPVRTFELALISLVQRAQGEHGVKHADFTRYRHHCSNRLQGLYKSLKLQHGRTKFVKRKIEPANVTDVRFLHVPVFSAERAWAYAMELKKEVESNMHLRKRRHLISRLAKASQFAREAARLVHKCCDARSALEAEAYALGMAGYVLLEKEVQWERALSRFMRAKRLYSELAKVAADSDAQSLYLQQIESMEPAIRYCNYQISRAGQAAPGEGQLEAMVDEQTELGALDGAALQQQLASLATQTVAVQSSSLTHIEWPPGNRLPVKHERVRAAVQQANDLTCQLDSPQEPMEVVPTASNSTAAGEAPRNSRAQLFDRLLQALNDARTQARTAMKADSGAQGGYEELEALESALTGLIAKRMMDKASLVARDLKGRFAAGLARGTGAAAGAGQKKAAEDKNARAAQVVRALDTLLRALTDLADLGVQGGGRAGEQLHDAAMLQAARVRASRCYYVAHSLLGSQKPLEAFALFGRAAERAQECSQESLPSTPVAELTAHVMSTQDMASLAQSAQAYKAVAHAEAASISAGEKDKVTTGVEKLALEQQAAAAASSLVDAPDMFESFAGSTTGNKAPARIYKFPFPMQAIPMRPIMLDTASAYLEYPDLSHRVGRAESQKNTGVLKSLTSWWGSARK